MQRVKAKPAAFDPSLHIMLDDAVKMSGYNPKHLSVVIAKRRGLFKRRVPQTQRIFFLRSEIEKLRNPLANLVRHRKPRGLAQQAARRMMMNGVSLSLNKNGTPRVRMTANTFGELIKQGIHFDIEVTTK